MRSSRLGEDGEVATADHVTSAAGRTMAQWFCLLGGGVLLIRGVGGLLVADASFATPGEGWHHLVHLASGLVLLITSFAPFAARAAAIAFGVAYGGLGLVGLLGADDVGIISLQTPDNVFHSLIGLASLGAGLLSSPEH